MVRKMLRRVKMASFDQPDVAADPSCDTVSISICKRMTADDEERAYYYWSPFFGMILDTKSKDPE
jgi:hypothetical protein